MYFRENARPPTSKNGSRPCWEQLVQDLSHHRIHKTLGIFIKLHNIRHSKKMQKRFRHSEDFVQCPRFPTPTTSRFGCLGMSEGPDYVSSRSRMLKGDPVILLALRNISWTGKPRGLSTAPKVGWHWWWIWWLDVLRKSDTARALVKNPKAWGPGSLKFLFLNTGKFAVQQAEGPSNS